MSTPPPPPGQPPVDPPAGSPYGGYAAAPPPTGPGRGGPTFAPSFDGGSAYSGGWKVLFSNAGPFLAVGAIAFLVRWALNIVGVTLDGGINAAVDASEPGRIGTEIQLFQSIFSTLGELVVFFLGLGVIRMALDVLDGRRAELGRLFSGYNVGMAVLVAFVVYVLTSLSVFLCLVGVLVVGPLLIFALPSAVDTQTDVGSSLGRSIELVKDNVGGVVVLTLIYIGTVVGTVCTCYLAGVILMPLSFIALAVGWRQMTQGRLSIPA